MPQHSKGCRGSMSLKGLPFDLWLKRFFLFLKAEKNVSPHTLRAYQNDLANFSAFAKDRVSDLSNFRKSRLLIREFWAGLSSRGARSSTLMRKLAALRSFLKFLILEGALDENPFRYLPS